MIRLPETIKHLIIINVLFFVATMAIQNFDLFELFTLHYFEHPKFRIWQLITGIFMHGSISHLFFNMIGLYFLGTPMLQLWGKNRFLFFYLSAGIGASLIFLLERQLEFQNAMSELLAMGATKEELYGLFSDTKSFQNPIMETANRIYGTRLLGASGAIFGLLAAFGWYFPNAKIYLYFFIPITVKYFVPVVVLADLISGLTGVPILSPVNVAYFAHVAGAVIGLIIAYVWKKNQHRMY
ncbi:rhomboid family intramembrane serine protease [Ochrovirga pacifica]|uniref:rhomboid family intramembrane serine protease n=1 Tax=Ochrovirga pacifica TaxID=1042376 RepID=UPI000255A7AF|nr:rhomboid family intramembrane serine protease [Ochrovirga pacifica]